MPNVSRKLLLSSLLVLVVFTEACQAARQVPTGVISLPTELQPIPTELSPTVAPLLQKNPLTPRLAPTRTIVPTPTAPAVSITANGGDLAIRAGPDPSFDAVATLKDGQTVPVLARSIQDGWVQIPIPSQAGATGWVSTQTGYSKVDGYVLDLPMITTVEWPFGAYLLNCTPHQLLLQPGDKLVPSVSAAPANRVWFPPGLYTAYDADVQGQPVITQVKLWPHTDLSIIKDGTGQKYTCP